MSKRKKAKYSRAEKIRILKAAGPRIKAKHPLRLIAIWQKVPYGTLKQWLDRLETEGLDSLNDHRPDGATAKQELNLILSLLAAKGLPPTPTHFLFASSDLQVTTKASSLYEYYRRENRKSRSPDRRKQQDQASAKDGGPDHP